MRFRKKKRVKDRIDEDNLYFKCPHCKVEIAIPRCRYCVHIDSNFDDYQRSECKKTCDMFHRSFKKKKQYGFEGQRFA